MTALVATWVGWHWRMRQAMHGGAAAGLRWVTRREAISRNEFKRFFVMSAHMMIYGDGMATHLQANDHCISTSNAELCPEIHRSQEQQHPHIGWVPKRKKR